MCSVARYAYNKAMMTKKDFEAIAHTLDANHAPLTLVQDFADMLKEDNPRFDRDTFIRAATHNIKKDLVLDLAILDGARQNR